MSKWIVDDAGTLINMETRNTYDYMEDIVDILNVQEERIRELETENKQLIKEWFESEKDYIIESYHDNTIRRDEKIHFLKEEFKARFGDVE